MKGRYTRFLSDGLPLFGQQAGVFAQDDIDVATWLSVSSSGRVDVHSEYGTFFSPRVSALMRAGGWSSRVSAGRGFFGPTALTEETEAAGLARLRIPSALRAERSTSASVDLTRSAGPFSATASYAYVRSVEPSDTPGRSVDVALTPRHGVSLVGMWEREGKGRVGLECYYTGVQRLEANPFRDESRPYILFGALVERRVGRYRLFINAENLGNVKQSGWDPLQRSTRGVDGRWTVDAWAPLDGRNVNGGVRVAF